MKKYIYSFVISFILIGNSFSYALSPNIIFDKKEVVEPQSEALYLPWDSPVLSKGGMITGVEGLKHAHAILEAENAIGIVIGSTAASLWSGAEKDEELRRRSDIDVLVLTPGFDMSIPSSERGTDFFAYTSLKDSHTARMKKEHGSTVDCLFVNDATAFVRAFISIDGIDQYKPGLYLLDRDSFVDLILFDTLSKMESNYRKQINPQVIEKFREIIGDRHVGKKLSSLWIKHFGHDKVIPKDSLHIQAFHPNDLMAINSITPYIDKDEGIHQLFISILIEIIEQRVPGSNKYTAPMFKTGIDCAV